MGMPTGSVVQFNFMFTVLVLGFSMVWLLAERIGNRNRFVTFLLAVLVYLGFLMVNLLGSGFGDDTVQIACLAVISIVGLLPAFFLAGVIAGKPFNVARFLIYLPVALFMLLMVCFLVAFHMVLLIGNDNFPFSSMVVEALTASFFASLIYYIAILPFVVLLMNSPFWRKRFDAVLGGGK